MTRDKCVHVGVAWRKAIARRLLALDVLAWPAALILGKLGHDGFGLALLEPWRILVVMGLAAVLQAGVGLTHGLYTGRRLYSGTLNETGAVAGAVGATTGLLVIVDLWVIPRLVPLSIILAGGIVALALMGAPRYVWRLQAERQKQRQKRCRLIQRRMWIPLDEALAVAEEFIAGLAACDAVLCCSYVGSLRRMRETVGDIDIVAASEHPAKVADAFLSLSKADRVVKRRSEGEPKVAIVTTEGIQIELTIVPPGAFGGALISRSGSRSHNNKVRKLALRRGYKLSSGPKIVEKYWLYRLTTARRGASKREETEEQIYGRLGMQWIPPTLREDRGEIEAALERRLPRLVELSDIRGDLHAHSVYSDGVASLRELVLAASELGYEYFAITDHSECLGRQGLELSAIERQREEVRTLNGEFEGRIVILHGVELSIGPNGQLYYPYEVLEGFDLVVASIHHGIDQDSDQFTKRLVRAIEHPCVNIIGHPTGRHIGKRAPVRFDFDEVCRAAVRHGVALEINAHPERLDLPDEHVRQANSHGVCFAISTGAHSRGDLRHMRFGVATAQRGWTIPEVVINTWSLEQLNRFFAKGDVGKERT